MNLKTPTISCNLSVFLNLLCLNRGAASNYTHVSQSGKSPNSSQSRIWLSSKTKWNKCGARNIKRDGVLTTCNVSANEGGMDARLPAVLNFAAVFFPFSSFKKKMFCLQGLNASVILEQIGPNFHPSTKVNQTGFIFLCGRGGTCCDHGQCRRFQSETKQNKC